MKELHVVADDVTGACDVGAELAVAGHAVRVGVTGPVAKPPPGEVQVVNTQTRALTPDAAYARVLRAVRDARPDVLLKKIDTALRGHLGAELDAALTGAGAASAFVLAAIPVAGRVTRGGCQWFGDVPLAATEFARDPEGPGAESSIPAVLARETGRRAEVIEREAARRGDFAERVRQARRRGTSLFVVDAETDDDVSAAVAAILALERPVCVAGSIALAAALAARVLPRLQPTGTRGRGRFEPPALVVSGSLHSRARGQIASLVRGGQAIDVAREARWRSGDVAAVAPVAASASAVMAAGGTAVVAPPPADGAPPPEALRAVEGWLAAVTAAVVAQRPPRTIVLIGGETSHAVLRRIGATEVLVHGRLAPLVAIGEVARGPASGTALVIKGGSGGEADVLAAALGAGVDRTDANRRARECV